MKGILSLSVLSLFLCVAAVATADKAPTAAATASSPTAAASKPAAPAPESGAKPAGPPKPWKDMSAKERGTYMKDVVAPHMKVAFQQFDGEEYKKFGCETCHGKKAKARKFKMPNPDIFVLPATPAEFK